MLTNWIPLDSPAALNDGFVVAIMLEAKEGESPSFSLILENDDGKRYRYHFVLEVNRVRLARKTLWEPNAEAPKTGAIPVPPPPADPGPSRTQKLQDWFKSTNPFK